jgi:hypothetical protein
MLPKPYFEFEELKRANVEWDHNRRIRKLPSLEVG